MAKRLVDIINQIKSEQLTFKIHLEKSLDKSVLDLLEKLSKNCHVYIFSGIIRNFFLKINYFRDIDLFIDGKVDLEQILKQYQYRKNSFGGYKITINETSIDIWFMQDTWALNNSQSVIDFDLVKYIPNTAFFDFSSIMYSYNDHIFFVTKHFARFIRDKKIGLVYKPNANYALCVINSLYYSDKLKLKLTDTLIKHIKYLHNNNNEKYDETQLKHFGKIIYTRENIDQKILNLRLNRPYTKHL